MGVTVREEVTFVNISRTMQSQCRRSGTFQRRGNTFLNGGRVWGDSMAPEGAPMPGYLWFPRVKISCKEQQLFSASSYTTRFTEAANNLQS